MLNATAMEWIHYLTAMLFTLAAVCLYIRTTYRPKCNYKELLLFLYMIYASAHLIAHDQDVLLNYSAGSAFIAITLTTIFYPEEPQT